MVISGLMRWTLAHQTLSTHSGMSKNVPRRESALRNVCAGCVGSGEGARQPKLTSWPFQFFTNVLEQMRNSKAQQQRKTH